MVHWGGPGKELGCHTGEAGPVWKDISLGLLHSHTALVDADVQRALAEADRPLLGRPELVLPGRQGWG